MEAVVSSTLRARLAAALSGTGEAQRNIADLELPRALNYFVTPQRVAELRPAAVLVAVIAGANAPAVLLTRRTNSLRAHSGQVSLPGGACEAGDKDLTATALREAEEEVGLPPARVEVFGYLDDYPTTSGFRVTPVVGWVDGSFEPRPQQTEVAEVFAVPLQVILDPANYERAKFLRSGVQWPYFKFCYNSHRVWGATAGMLRDLSLKVQRSGK